MTREEADAKRDELYRSLSNLNERISALDHTRIAIRRAIKDLEMEVAQHGLEDRKAH